MRISYLPYCSWNGTLDQICSSVREVVRPGYGRVVVAKELLESSLEMEQAQPIHVTFSSVLGQRRCSSCANAMEIPCIH